jgi:VCBS repeat protein
MRVREALCALRAVAACAGCAGLALAASPVQRPGTFEVSALQLPKDLRVQAAATADLDGDGRVDVIVAANDPAKPFARSLQIFHARAAGARFSNAPDQSLALTRDVVAWTSADVDPSPGEELLLFTARAVFAWRAPATKEAAGAAGQAYTRLFEVDLLWQLPDGQEAWIYPDAVQDLDGDGLPDLALPEPGGYAIAFQRRAEGVARFDRQESLRMPSEDQAESTGSRWSTDGSQKRLNVSFHLGDDTERRASSTLLSVRESCPAPHWLDFDADGRTDLLAQGERSLYVWIQGADSRFAPAPRHAFPLPVPADRDRRLDPSYASHAVDLNGDARADVVIFAGDKRSEDVRTQMLVFEQGAGRGDAAQTPQAPLFGPKALPQQLLVLGGFVAKPSFEDVFLDGLPDLVVRAVRPDLIDQIRSASTESIDADVYVYRNEAGVFGKRPALSWRVNVPLKSFDLTLRFLGDVNGDRVSDLLVRDKPERLRVLAPRRQGDGLVLEEKPLYELALDKDASVAIERRRGQRVADVLVLEQSQVLCVRLP